MSPSRFVRAAFLKPITGYAKANEQEAVTFNHSHFRYRRYSKRRSLIKRCGWQIHSDTTQWVTIKDLTNNVWYLAIMTIVELL